MTTWTTDLEITPFYASEVDVQVLLRLSDQAPFELWVTIITVPFGSSILTRAGLVSALGSTAVDKIEQAIAAEMTERGCLADILRNAREAAAA